MIEINLVPDVKQEFLRAQRTRNTVISIAIVVGIAAVAAIVLISVIVGGQLALSALNDRTIASENRKLQSVEDLNETVTLQNQLKQLATMHDQNTINSRIFDILTAVNPPARSAPSCDAASMPRARPETTKPPCLLISKPKRSAVRMP